MNEVLVVVKDTHVHSCKLHSWWCDSDIRRRRLVEWTLMHYVSFLRDVLTQLVTEVDMAYAQVEDDSMHLAGAR